MKNKSNITGIWLTSDILQIQELNTQEKAILCLIDGLAKRNKKGCYASNLYFSKVFNISKDRARKIINNLANRGFIISNYDIKQKINKRTLKLNNQKIKECKKYLIEFDNNISMVENDHTSMGENDHTSMGENDHTSMGENDHHIIKKSITKKKIKKNDNIVTCVKPIARVREKINNSDDIKKIILNNLKNNDDLWWFEMKQHKDLKNEIIDTYCDWLAKQRETISFNAHLYFRNTLINDLNKINADTISKLCTTLINKKDIANRKYYIIGFIIKYSQFITKANSLTL